MKVLAQIAECFNVSTEELRRAARQICRVSKETSHGLFDSWLEANLAWSLNTFGNQFCTRRSLDDNLREQLRIALSSSAEDLESRFALSFSEWISGPLCRHDPSIEFYLTVCRLRRDRDSYARGEPSGALHEMFYDVAAAVTH